MRCRESTNERPLPDASVLVGLQEGVGLSLRFRVLLAGAGRTQMSAPSRFPSGMVSIREPLERGT